jgi:crotonobetainyl-CoA:carnitine CoA-transferase CaiB-like acyl-CoA transferase
LLIPEVYSTKHKSWPFAPQTLDDICSKIIKIELSVPCEPLRQWRLLNVGMSVWRQIQFRHKRSVALNLNEVQVQDIVCQ